MRLRVTFRSPLIITVAGLSLLIALVVLTTGDALLKLDYGQIRDRAAWQLPDRVIENLEIETGNRIADIGAGAGYFTFRPADRVGPSGKVYAVDVEDDMVGNLRERVNREGRTNVEVILGKADDPLVHGSIRTVACSRRLYSGSAADEHGFTRMQYGVSVFEHNSWPFFLSSAIQK